MTLSPTERAKVLQMVADQIVAQLLAETGGLAHIVLIPVPVVARMFGISPARVGKLFKVVTISHRSHGVSLAQLQAFTAGKDIEPSAPGAKAA